MKEQEETDKRILPPEKWRNLGTPRKDLCYDEDDKKCGPRDINIAFKDTDTNEPATESNPIWSTFDKKLKKDGVGLIWGGLSWDDGWTYFARPAKGYVWSGETGTSTRKVGEPTPEPEPEPERQKKPKKIDDLKPCSSFSMAIDKSKGRRHRNRSRSRFIKTTNPRFQGDSGGDFTPYKQKLMKLGLCSFDEFYDAIVNCFGDEWRERVLPSYGMDYFFRDEHERAFKILKNNLERNTCPEETGRPPILDPDPAPVPEPEPEPEPTPEPEEPAKPIDLPEYDLRAGKGPRTPSAYVDVRRGFLEYGKDDPMNIYPEGGVKDGLDSEMAALFGEGYTWKKYKSDNYEDLTKQVVIARLDRTGDIEADIDKKPEILRGQQPSLEKKDKVVSAPTVWPIHVAKSLKEFSNTYNPQKDYEAIIFFDSDSQKNNVRSQQERFQLTLPDEEGLNTIPDKTRDMLERRLGLTGVGDNQGAFGVVAKNPYEGLSSGGAETVDKALNVWSKKINQASEGGRPSAQSVLHVKDQKKRPLFWAKGDPGAADLPKKNYVITHDERIIERAKSAGLATGKLLVSTASAKTRKMAGGSPVATKPLQINFKVGESDNSLEIGRIYFIPKNGGILSKSEKVLFDRLGIKSRAADPIATGGIPGPRGGTPGAEGRYDDVTAARMDLNTEKTNFVKLPDYTKSIRDNSPTREEMPRWRGDDEAHDEYLKRSRKIWGSSERSEAPEDERPRRPDEEGEPEEPVDDPFRDRSATNPMPPARWRSLGVSADEVCLDDEICEERFVRLSFSDEDGKPVGEDWAGWPGLDQLYKEQNISVVHAGRPWSDNHWRYVAKPRRGYQWQDAVDSDSLETIETDATDVFEPEERVPDPPEERGEADVVDREPLEASQEYAPKRDDQVHSFIVGDLKSGGSVYKQHQPNIITGHGASMNKPILALVQLMKYKDQPTKQLTNEELKNMLAYYNTLGGSNYIAKVASNRIEQRDRRGRLIRSVQRKLKRTGFPLGVVLKSDTEKYLQQLGLNPKMGIRFKPGDNKQSARDYFDFMRLIHDKEKIAELGIKDEVNKVLYFMTRTGLEVGGDRESKRWPGYVRALEEAGYSISSLYGKGGLIKKRFHYSLVINNQYLVSMYTKTKPGVMLYKAGGLNSDEAKKARAHHNWFTNKLVEILDGVIPRRGASTEEPIEESLNLIFNYIDELME